MNDKTAVARISTLLLLLGLAACDRGVEPRTDAAAPAEPTAAPATTEVYEGLLYGRVTMADGEFYEGRLRFGGNEEALWSNTFNAARPENPWVGHVPSSHRGRKGLSFEIFGIEINLGGDRNAFVRPFMARFGDIARIDARGRELRVTLRSGSVHELDRYGADDLADGLRVWDATRGVVDLGERRIRTIELFAPPPMEAVPRPLYGTVHTRHGVFTGLVQWDREECLVTDALDGMTDDGERSLRFETIRAIARRSRTSSLVTLLDGTEVELSGSRNAGDGNRGLYVDDARYGRVLVSWDAFERVEFSPGPVAPAYGAFAPGRALTGTVLTRSGDRLTGRLVYDRDESETTETLDAPLEGIDYTIPFARIASIMLPDRERRGARHATVILRSGEALQLERAGDLGDGNGGMLIFGADGRSPGYVPWADVRQIDFDGA